MTTETMDESQRRFVAFEEGKPITCGYPDCPNQAQYELMVYPPDGGGSEGHAGLLCGGCVKNLAALLGGKAL
jgi:hypothetical protein